MKEPAYHASSGECLVYYGMRDTPAAFGANVSAERHVAIEWCSAEELFNASSTRDEPSVLIVDEAMLPRLDALEKTPDGMVIVAADGPSAHSLGARVYVDASDIGVDDAASRACLLDGACRLAESQWEAASAERAFSRSEADFDELRRIGIALMHEQDRQALLDLIISHGKRLTEADGGGVLLLDQDEHGAPELRPMVFRLDSLPEVDVPAVRFPVDDTSMVGHAALTRESVVVADAQHLPPGTPFHASEEWEELYGYPARSMLAVPMITRRDDELGVVFFINRKTDPNVSIMSKENADRYIVPFTDRHVRLARVLASLAAVSIENARLYNRIENIFESVVTGAVSAVDARDPTTAGHSLRVADLTMSIAEAVEHTKKGPYRGVHFTTKEMRELKFAALLHDIGKIAVHEDVLIKAKKLPPVMWERLDARFDLIRRTLELDHCRLRACATDSGAPDAAVDESQLEEQLRELDALRAIVRGANDPSVLTQETDVSLRDIAQRSFQRADGREEAYLTADELCFLEIQRGTLDERERAEVESHVEKTHQFLEQIPWPDGLKNVVVYASGHHEKLNGTGYPNRLTEKEIPLQTRIITLADMFDALTASDRPYKPAVAPEKALEIIRVDADKGLVDGALVDILMESQAYKEIQEKDWREM